MQCPCQSGKTFNQCCEPIITGPKQAETAEQLMRARYSAYTQVQMDFIEKTHDPKTKHDIDLEANRKWAETTKWTGLEILSTKQGGIEDEAGLVEFKATFETEEGPQIHHELSEFRKHKGSWYFTDGKSPGVQTVVRSEAKIGRNDPCPCGSGKKYKKCCGNA
ncbi:YchJ family protein [Candidatus Nitrospira neomarina]|uniref:YchJ family protein n=1 Tax=Candidatus Nitrospira neomarina TaxID=3020899 RepID=A0AA96K0W0_9BACT|nr:YchJ family protein [Candidatus Nitrospira neomarina]WNM62461.1 YchJ family protein [Candidatus Nitrospira neomarina]